MKKFRQGNSGPYTPEYHALLGKAQWIVVRRLLLQAPSGATADDPSLQELSEGDLATVFSQFGDVLDVRFVRHNKTGRFLGTAFVKFADYRSAIMAADEMNSNTEKGEHIFLSPIQSAGGDNHRGIAVERCEEVEVPALCSAEMQPYPTWLSKFD